MLDWPAVSTLTQLWFRIFLAREAYMSEIRLCSPPPAGSSIGSNEEQRVDGKGQPQSNKARPANASCGRKFPPREDRERCG